jgi:ubiquinone biosynthesis protein UbiJ
MNSTRPLFGTRPMYEALAQRVNNDPEWLQRAGHLSFSMAHVYTGVVNHTFSFRFDGGRLVDLSEHDTAVDFVLTAPAETWEQVMTRQLDAKRAVVSKQIQVEGDMLTMIKHMVVLKGLVDHLCDLDVRIPSQEGAAA